MAERGTGCAGIAPPFLLAPDRTHVGAVRTIVEAAYFLAFAFRLVAFFPVVLRVAAFFVVLRLAAFFLVFFLAAMVAHPFRCRTRIPPGLVDMHRHTPSTLMRSTVPGVSMHLGSVP